MLRLDGVPLGARQLPPKYKMSLQFTIGQSSLTGPRPRNEDYVGVVTPEKEQLNIKGALIAVADGVSGNAGGGEASEMTMRTVTSDYYATPDTWKPLASLDKVLTAANRGLLERLFWSIEIAGESPVISSTSGFCIWFRNWRA